MVVRLKTKTVSENRLSFLWVIVSALANTPPLVLGSGFVDVSMLDACTAMLVAMFSYKHEVHKVRVWFSEVLGAGICFK